jgi:hypothetical protein
MVGEALKPYLPKESSYEAYGAWVQMRQLDSPLREFGPRWLQAYARVLGSDHKLRPYEAYTQLECALNRRIAGICFPQGCMAAVDARLPLESIIARGVREEEARREQLLVSAAFSKSPAGAAAPGGSNTGQSSSSRGGKSRGSNRKGSQSKAPTKKASNHGVGSTINFIGRTQREATCFLCGQSGHRYHFCSKFDEATAKARRKGLTEIELPYRPRRERSSARQSAVGSINYNRTSDDHDENDGTDGGDRDTSRSQSESTVSSDDDDSSRASTEGSRPNKGRSGSSGKRRPPKN